MKINAKKIINNLFPCMFILVWLMPVSNKKGVLDSSLNNRMIIMAVCLIIFAIFYGNVAYKRRLSKTSMLKVAFVAGLLIAFSIPTAILHPEANFGLRQFTLYITLMMLLSHKMSGFRPNALWRVCLYSMTILICVCGVLMLLGTYSVWDFFSTYYVNHISYIYAQFQQLRRPVTFFAANSTTVPVYFLLYMFFELCERGNKLALIIKVVLIILIISCSNNSSILACAFIAGYYLFNNEGKMSVGKILKKIMIMILIVIALSLGYAYISDIMLSKANGILGRYTSTGAGNLLVDIKYIVDFNLPIGCVFISNLFYADSGPIIYTLMGSIVLPIIIYSSLYSILKYYMPSPYSAKYLFLCIFGFEVAYPIMIEQRIMPLIMFFLLYVKEFGIKKNLSNKKQII